MKKHFDIYQPSVIIKDHIMQTTREVPKGDVIRLESTETIIQTIPPRTLVFIGTSYQDYIIQGFTADQLDELRSL